MEFLGVIEEGFVCLGGGVGKGFNFRLMLKERVAVGKYMFSVIMRKNPLFTILIHHVKMRVL